MKKLMVVLLIVAGASPVLFGASSTPKPAPSSGPAPCHVWQMCFWQKQKPAPTPGPSPVPTSLR